MVWSANNATENTRMKTRLATCVDTKTSFPGHVFGLCVRNILIITIYILTPLNLYINFLPNI